jgi:hypothetical protein
MMTVTLSTVPLSARTLDEVVVGNDIAVGRDEEAEPSEPDSRLRVRRRGSLAAGPGWPKRRRNSAQGSPAPGGPARAAVWMLTTAAEPCGEVGKGHGRTARRHPGGILRDLRTDRTGRDRESAPADQQGSATP